MVERRAFPLGLVGSLLLAGCGGGGGSSASGGDSSRIDNYGAVTTRSVGAIQEPVIMGSRQAVVTGVYGATFNDITVKLPPINALTADERLGSTSIAYNFRGYAHIYDYGTGAITEPEFDEGIYANSSMPSLSANRIAYLKFIPGKGQQMMNSFYDGTDRRQLSNSTAQRRWPTLSPDGRWMAFVQYDSAASRNRLYVMPALGGTPVTLTPATDNVDQPTFSPDSTKIAFARQAGGSGSYTISTIGVNGAGLVNVSFGVANWNGITWSPGGQDLYATFLNGSVYTIWKTAIGDIGYGIYNSSDYLGRIAIAPSGDRFAVERGGANPGVYLVGLGGVDYGRLIANGDSPSWGPPATERRMVGASASMGATTTGFAFGQVGQKVTGFLTFDAVTPSTMTLTPQANPNPNQANVVCTLRGDQINNLKFVNDQRGGVVTVISSATSSTWANGAVVSFEADTGRVASVIPWKQSPTATRQGDVVTYQGTFLGAWDGTGKNLAPGGTSVVRLNTATGALLGTP